MTKTLLQGFEEWFDGFVKGFTMENPVDQQNINLKIDHTYRVQDAAYKIASQLHLSENEVLLAQTMALFHDLGRFPQYKKYRTYKDSISENHATLSLAELKENKVLEVLPMDEQELILRAIEHHNMARVPDELLGQDRFFTQLLRDADKVDILFVVTDYYEKQHIKQNKTIQLELIDRDEISESILASFLKGEIIMSEDMRFLNDFKLLQLAWINDLNFVPALQLIVEADYFNRIIATLPNGERCDKVSAYIQQIIDKKLDCC